MATSCYFLLVLFATSWAAFLPYQDILEEPEPVANDLRIGAFNIRQFGVNKMKNPVVVKSLKLTLIRYDIVLIQEIKDVKDIAIYELLAEVNSASPNDPYDIVISDRLGPSTQKEQYAYFYRPSRVRVTDTYQWPLNYKIFERPPFVVRFRTTNSVQKEFGFIGIHTKPTEAPREIDALVDVYDGMVGLWQMQDFILGGDFNAGCRYVTDSKWKNIRLRTQTRFLWLLGDERNTTVTDTNCPYDRFVLGGSTIQRNYVANSADVYIFDNVQGLTKKEALDVSDHYPIEMELS